MILPSKLTMGRVCLSIIIIILLLFPLDETGINIPQLFVNEKIVIDVRYLIAGSLFVITTIITFFNSAASSKKSTYFDKLADIVTDKVLVDSVLIALSAQGFVHPIIPVVIIARDLIVDAIKMAANASGATIGIIKMGKAKTACLMIGLTLTLFYNLPFELFNLRVADFLLILAAVFSVVSGVQYYGMNSKYIFKEVSNS